ncbi:MAG: PIN domain-containing protein [Solirubrobacterales bacterium]
MNLEPIEIHTPCLFDTGVWSWVRDRRFPQLAGWFDDLASSGLVLVSDLVSIELMRATPNLDRANDLAQTLYGFEHLPISPIAVAEARDVQMALAASGDHRTVSPLDILHAVTAADAGVPLIHYDRDYERIAAVTGLDQHWFVPLGSFAG